LNIECIKSRWWRWSWNCTCFRN